MKLGIERIKQRIREIHGDTVTLKADSYTNTKEKCTFIDKDYGEWSAELGKILRGSKHRLRAASIRKMPVAGNSLQECYPEIALEWDFDKNQLKPKEVNKSSAEKYWFKCLHNKEHTSYIISLANKVKRPGCPECRMERFIEKSSTANANESLGFKYPELVKEWRDEISIFSVYPHSNRKYKFVCTKTGQEYFAAPNDKVRGNGCSCCRYVRTAETRKLAKNGNSFAEKFPFLLEEWADIRDPFLANFGSAEKYLFKCIKNNEHGVYECALHNKIKDRSCPKCANSYTRPEQFIEEKLNIKKFNQRLYVSDDKFYKPDFQLNENLFLNSDGLYWHSTEVKEKKYHLKMRKDFENIGKRILQFYDDQIYNQWPIIESIVNNARSITINKVMARKCETRIVKPEMFGPFFNENHLMGNYAKARCIGLYYKNELVSALSYTVSEYTKCIKIQRFASKLNTVVIGGFQKLLTLLENAAKTNDIKRIISFCDLRYTTGKSYERAGFKRVNVTLGFFWYDYKLEQRLNRLKCKAGDGKTEAQNAAEKGYIKLYDAGQAKYVKDL